MRSSIHAIQPKTGGLCVSFLLAIAVSSVSGVAYGATPRPLSKPTTNNKVSHADTFKTVADLPKPDFQWKKQLILKAGVGYAEIGGTNAVAGNQVTAINDLNVGLEFATYRQFSFNTTLGFITGDKTSIYKPDGNRSQTTVEPGLNWMLGVESNFTKNLYASTSLGVLIQRVEGISNRTSVQPSYQIGVGYNVTPRASAELGYYGTLGSPLKIENDQLHGNTRYNAGVFSIRYKL